MPDLRDRVPVLRETVEALAGIDRTPCSPGEAQAAAWLADRLAKAGADVEIEAAASSTGFPTTLATLCATAAAGGVAALAGARRAGGLLAGAAAALIVDDISNGFRPVRRVTSPDQPTTNVVAQIGEDDAPRTVVVLAHHDAAQTGLIFDQTFQQQLASRFPGIVERIDTALPIWWPVPAGPLLVAAGAAKRRRRMIATGTALSAVATAAFADIARSPTVPGANDNLSACAVLVQVAEALRDEAAEGVRVLLVSCGAEEVVQGGIYGFAEKWFGELDRDTTYFLTLDTVGSPRLIMLEGEGAFVMEDYTKREFRDMVARTAEREGIGLRRGMRARSSTDAVIPSRAGFPTATLASMDRHKLLSNYHLMSDTPENLDYETVAAAAALTEAVIRGLGRGEPA